MGGCFAQNSASKTVDTYWPAHAVTVADKTLILKNYEADLSLPFWAAGVRAGGRIENVSITGTATNLLNWGEWGSVADALYLGTKANNTPGNAAAYSVCSGGVISAVSAGSGSDAFVEYMEVDAREDSFVLTSSLGDAETKVKGWPSNYTGMWRIRIKGNGHVFDVASFWWYNDLQHQYFMVQPMCSVSGEPAFFTHGYNILTEL